MKFCPNCGFPLEEKKICNCGYNVDTNEVDEKTFEQYKETEQRKNIMLNNIQDTNMFFNNNQNLNEQPIFNKDNDNLKSEDIERILKEYNENKD